MSPEAAGEALLKMNFETGVAVLSAVDPRKAGKILDALPPDKSAKYLDKITLP
jgi:flagellar motility protein MotE (MotC chaperone)